MLTVAFRNKLFCRLNLYEICEIWNLIMARVEFIYDMT